MTAIHYPDYLEDIGLVPNHTKVAEAYPDFMVFSFNTSSTEIVHKITSPYNGAIIASPSIFADYGKWASPRFKANFLPRFQTASVYLFRVCL